MNRFSLAGLAEAFRRLGKGADGNGSGDAYGLTMFSAVEAGREAALQSLLEELPLGAGSPLARLGQLHCSRLHVLRELVYQGPPQEPEPLNSAYLVFTASFDGELDRFLDDICVLMPVEADAIWGHCVGYPGTRDPAAFKRYVAHNQVHNHYFLGPYPHSTVAEVREGLALRRRVTDFAAQAQEMDGPTLQQAFGQAFGRE